MPFLGWFSLLTMIPVRSQWGRYNLSRSICFLKPRKQNKPKLTQKNWGMSSRAWKKSAKSFHCTVLLTGLLLAHTEFFHQASWDFKDVHSVRHKILPLCELSQDFSDHQSPGYHGLIWVKVGPWPWIIMDKHSPYFTVGFPNHVHIQQVLQIGFSRF